MEFSKLKFSLLKDPPDDRDIEFGQYIVVKKLPLEISWATKVFRVRDQGDTPTCVGQSCSELKTVQEFFEHSEFMDFDALWLYNECKKIDGFPNEEGTFIRVALKILEQRGIPWENLYYKIKCYARIENLEELLLAIASNGPCVLGVEVFETWANPINGIIRLPGPDMKSLGGHAILVTGFNQNERLIEFKNSWGKDWGDNGYGYLPFDYTKYMIDSWTVIDLEDRVVKGFLNTEKLFRKKIEVTKRR
jgi:hypothetical protein